MKSCEKYEFIVCEGLENIRFFVRHLTKENIWCTLLCFAPSNCFLNNVYIRHDYQKFLDIYDDVLSVTTQTVVAEAQSLEDLKLEVPEYLI
jgi:predicted metal-dependent enzyme (double-stranded beta helix superfamily)